jgi:hypothetical protein
MINELYANHPYPVRITDVGFVLEPDNWRQNARALNTYDHSILRPNCPLSNERIFLDTEILKNF